MPIPDWVWRETKHIHEKAFHVLAAMFVDGREFVLEDGSEVRVLREEYPVEEGLVLRDASRRVWRQLEAKGLVRYQAADHMAINGRLKGSYVASLQDPIAQFSSVRNKDARWCAILPASAPLQGEEFESEARRLTRAGANTTGAGAGAAIHPPPQPPPPPPTTPPVPQEIPTLSKALELCGVDNPGDQLTKWGFNNVAVALRELVAALRRASLGKQPAIESRAKYVMYQLRLMNGKTFEEVTDFTYLVHFLTPSAPADSNVVAFPGSRGEA